MPFAIDPPVIALGTPITPENAPPGTRVKCVDDDGVEPSERLRAGDTYVVDSYVNYGLFGYVRLVDSSYDWALRRFVLAGLPAVTPATGYKREGKPDFTLLVYEMLEPVIRVLEFGERKHGRYNYLTNPKVTDLEIVAAAGRHAFKATMNHRALDDGPDGSGQPHLAACAANCLMLLHRWASKAAI